MIESKHPLIPKPLSKTDEKGSYAYFPGITVVSACYPRHRAFCEAIYHALSDSALIREYYSPLPAASYHMTEIDLYTAQRQGGEWYDFVSASMPHLREINHELQTHPIQPRIEEIKINIKGCISLILSLPESQVTQIQETARALGHEKGIPPVFHVTLAYSRPHKERSREINARLREAITHRLSPIIARQPLAMLLEPAKLCHFSDMTAFHPWNAEENPFARPTPSRASKSLLSSLCCCFFAKADEADETPEQIDASTDSSASASLSGAAKLPDHT